MIFDDLACDWRETDAGYVRRLGQMNDPTFFWECKQRFGMRYRDGDLVTALRRLGSCRSEALRRGRGDLFAAAQRLHCWEDMHGRPAPEELLPAIR